MDLKSFIPYYGGKWRASRLYPAPRYDVIVEPFAGAAGYATRYSDRVVVLMDKDPIVAGLWSWLTKVSAAEILSLPERVEHVDQLHCSQEAKWLIGFWLRPGSAAPAKKPSSWGRDETKIRHHIVWGAPVRQRIASQVDKIRHWIVVNDSYENAPDVEATWYIDPPYQKAGKYYRHGSKGIDFDHLGAFCRVVRGQVIVCENDGADWLPFRHLGDIKSNRIHNKSAEAIWTNEGAS